MMKEPTQAFTHETDDSSSALSRSSSSSSSLSTGASSSQSSSFSSFFYRGPIAYPKTKSSQPPPPPPSRFVQKTASFDPAVSSARSVPTRTVKSWPLRKNNDWNQLVTTCSSTVMSLSSSEEETEDAFRLDPQQKQQREDRKVQRLVHLAKQQRNVELDAAATLPRNGQVVTPVRPLRPARERIVPAEAVKPILDIPVAPNTHAPVDIDAWMDVEDKEDQISSFSSTNITTCTPISLTRDAASFESDETRRISNKSKIPWTPTTLVRDLEAHFSGSPPASPEAPVGKSKSFWKRRSTLAAMVAVVLLVIAIVSLSMMFVGEMKRNRSSNQNNNKGMTTQTSSHTASPSTSPPTASPSARTNEVSQNISTSSSSTPLNHTPPLHMHRPKPVRSPTLSPTSAPSPVPSHEPTTAFSAAVWTQVGKSIQGKEDREQLGSSLALSRNGKVLAVGSRNFTIGNSTQAGRVQVFRWNVSSWIPRGQVLLGLSPVAHFGSAVALNRQGTIVAVSEPTLGSGAMYRSGGVRIFQWNEARSVWIGIGQIFGLIAFDYFGLSLEISGDGTRLVVSSPYHASSKGEVRIFDYNGTDWELLTSLVGSSESDLFGWDVALSEDGNLVCIGAPHDAKHGGYVRCFKEGGNATTWTQVGDDIVNEDFSGTASSDDFFGNSVSVSTWNGGHYVAIGAPFKSVHGAKVGLAAVYKLQQTKINATVHQYYSLVGSPVVGSADTDQLGYVVRLLNGHLVVSSPGSNKVGIYRWTGTDWESRKSLLTSNIVSSPQQDFGFALGLAQPDNQTFLMAVGAPFAKASNSSKGSSVGATQVYTTAGL